MPSAAPKPDTAEPPPQTDSPVKQRFLLRNFIEDIVLEKVDRTIRMLRGCECERCKKEVMAHVLNGLPGAYAVLEQGQVDATLTSLRAEYEVRVSAALIKAVQAVKNAPKH